MSPPTFNGIAITDRHSATTVFHLTAHWVQISTSVGSEKNVWACASGGSRPPAWTAKISIFHGCMVWIEKSVTRVTDRHHEACRVILSTPYTHDRYSLLHTFWFTTFDFQSRTCYDITPFPLKGFYLSLRVSTLPTTAVRFFTLTSNMHKVTSLLM